MLNLVKRQSPCVYELGAQAEYLVAPSDAKAELWVTTERWSLLLKKGRDIVRRPLSHG